MFQMAISYLTIACGSTSDFCFTKSLEICILEMRVDWRVRPFTETNYRPCPFFRRPPPFFPRFSVIFPAFAVSYRWKTSLIGGNTVRPDDRYLIYKCLNGDSAAFGILVDKYKAGIYAYVYAELGNFQDAQDVTQEVFLQAYRGLRSLRRWENPGFGRR